jgi:Ca-activated chloride channel family protein
MKKSRRFIGFILMATMLFSLMISGCSKKKGSGETTGRDIETRPAATEEDGAAQSKSNQTAAQKQDMTTRPSEYTATGKEEETRAEMMPPSSMDHSFTGEFITEQDYASYLKPTYPGTEEYSEYREAGFQEVLKAPLSTFSIDVDTASYAMLRRDIQYGYRPDPQAVRIEEMLNYFSYDYPEPEDGKPFAIHAEIGSCPWAEDHYLLKVGLQGKTVDRESLPKSNLVFLIDVSGSMYSEDKLPLLKNAFAQFVEALGEKDRISIVVYAGETGIVLDSVPGSEKGKILKAIKGLRAGGSTAGASGIELAYSLAEKNFILGGNNRVILATDGDFNVGPSSMEELEDIIEEKRESGIYLSVLGFGSGNIKDNKMELLADKGNGNYAYIDSPKEAKKVLVDEMSGTLLAIAKDVKIQLEFNPYSVASYRLIGYENRALQNEDFRDDTVDAGELGAGHSVTAIYEIIPGRAVDLLKGNESLKYQTQGLNPEYKDEITEIRLRYKNPEEEVSQELRKVVSFSNTPVKTVKNSEDFCFAAAVAQFGLILRESEYRGNASIESVLKLAEQGLGKDIGGYRAEFIDLVKTYDTFYGYAW